MRSLYSEGFNQKHRLLFIDRCTHMNRWEYIYTDASVESVPAGQRRRENVMSQSSSLTHTHIHTLQLKDRAQQASLVSCFISSGQSRSLVTIQRAERETHWQSRRQIPKTYKSFCRFALFFNVSFKEQRHTTLLVYNVTFFPSTISGGWMIHALQKTFKQQFVADTHTKYLQSVNVGWQNERSATTVWTLYLHKVFLNEPNWMSTKYISSPII